MQTPILSIITVCYQAKEALQTTLSNLLEQTWTDFEYIVIDGNSSDGTREYLEASIPRFTSAKISFHFVSEPDQGIYDAMNKGTRLAHGQWLLFLNAGDVLADAQVLDQIFHKPSTAQIIYGDTLCVYQGQTKLYPALPLARLPYEMAFCHQSVFIQRELMLSHPYDISYKVCADHQFFLSMYLQEKTFEYRKLPISIYEIAGYSDKNKLLAHKEQHRMQKELGVFSLSPSRLLRECIFYLKLGIKMLFGQKLIDLIRKKRLHQ
jgi:glycosyltransferase involved in cell wall biosynthesis